MFANLRSGSQVFILHKNATPYVECGTIENVLNIPMYGVYAATMPSMPVDLAVKVGEKLTTYKQIPSNVDFANVTNPNTGEEICIACNRDAINAEIQMMRQKSVETINSVPYHEQRIKSLDTLYEQMNPEQAEKVAQAKEINDLRGQVSNLTSLVEKLSSQLEERSSSSKPKKGDIV